MSERSTRKSFIVRIYRYDSDDCRRVTGLVEALDGSGTSLPFSDMMELGDIMDRLLVAGRGRVKGKKENRNA